MRRNVKIAAIKIIQHETHFVIYITTVMKHKKSIKFIRKT